MNKFNRNQNECTRQASYLHADGAWKDVDDGVGNILRLEHDFLHALRDVRNEHRRSHAARTYGLAKRQSEQDDSVWEPSRALRLEAGKHRQ